jgi:putative ABC transport system permease protein
MNFAEVLRTAVFALRGNWMRSALTSLGVIIGIAAVIVMVSVGQGTQVEIDKLVSGLGSNRLDISGAGGFGGGGVRLAAGSRYTLSEADADAIRRDIPEIEYVAASMRGGTQVVYGESNWSTQWQGVQPDWFDINDWVIASGQAFESRDYSGAAKSVILGNTVRQQLFGDQDPVGQSVRLGRVPFTVVATLRPKGQGGFGQDQDDLVVVPLETARRRLSGATALPPGAVQQISVGVGRAEDLSYAQGEVEALLRQRHRIQPGDDDDFSVRNIAQIVATRTQTTRLMSLLLGAVAGISLIVGGIGIMNIMLVSVTERIREIGLRMAVGAGPGDIRKQFLAEAMLISLIGGVIGILLGVVGALLVGKFGSLPVALNARVVGLAAGFSIATGLFFGYYPARKASLLDPIEALRQQ